MNIKASILTIGDELLVGQIVDTNSTFIAQSLTKLGYDIQEIISVKDETVRIIEAFTRALTQSDVVLVTGGLGPTRDDKTKQALCLLLDCELKSDPKVLKNITRLFKKRGYKTELNQLNKHQGLVPEKSIVVENTEGTAPCLWTEIDDKVLINLPGVPFEMKALMRKKIIPKLQKKYNSDAIYQHDVMIHNITESDLAILLEKWENNLPQSIQVAYLPSRAAIDLRLTSIGTTQQEAKKMLQPSLQSLKKIIKPYLLTAYSGKIEERLGAILRQQKRTISTAESCTGGAIAQLLTSVSGSSVYFVGGVVAYATDLKIRVLQVSKTLVEEKTVVSEEVAIAMAKGAQKKLKSSIAVATTGVAGPKKGEDGKPVGTAWIAVTDGENSLTQACFYPYMDREDFTKTITTNALLLSIRFLLDNNNQIAKPKRTQKKKVQKNKQEKQKT
ncbi:CinA family nicotinamide mononucleotide deamidase-related protein [Weeksella virosa]|uniref:CinA-like protein n=1 Tax=Weeksella virosa (strain ATCC 43766 / DSM 16922 / JCM 21250 / CCUG 30538 / CDC 9751 / IAM 14551 / NBRC 16016 / NCTC 11634 / CL345/78) TaxID=865938 RepID=F0NZA2_WEEVC|nr:CinA family nicotinamide mononucleotide deamidase-related protein [Weeksella virosa]ADX67231.1 competence/damage-inducible protein CinA [Weeksella virosa DSM 16922]SUP53500.1 competence damage-inducible protein A [Weeksella virosa]VEH63033.1 competence damage-inducible protein A [Weeksella virosa]